MKVNITFERSFNSGWLGIGLYYKIMFSILCIWAFLSLSYIKEKQIKELNNICDDGSMFLVPCRLL